MFIRENRNVLHHIRCTHGQESSRVIPDVCPVTDHSVEHCQQLASTNKFSKLELYFKKIKNGLRSGQRALGFM